MLILDLVDLGIDLFFYAQMQLIQPGLVYGPPPDTLSWCLFGFCIMSAVCLIIETLQNADDLFFGRRITWLTQSLSNFLVIFLEDIPILVINLIVTICRDGDPTLITVIKASAGIAIVVLRTVLMMLIYWLFDSKKNRFTLVLDVMSSIGLFVIAGISITIQLLNTFPTDSRGLIQATDPVAFNRMNYVSKKYLNGIGIFSAWPPESDTSDQFIWLADITQVINQQSIEIRIQTDYDKNPENYTLCFTKSQNTSCYSVLNKSMSKLIDDSNSIKKVLSDSSVANSGYEMSIQKQPAQPFISKIGYLDYNLNKLVAANETNRNCKLETASSLLYAKYANPAANEDTISYLKSSVFGASFFSLNYDLLTVDKIWRTGVFRCQMSGDLGPKLNRNIRLVC